MILPYTACRMAYGRDRLHPIPWPSIFSHHAPPLRSIFRANANSADRSCARWVSRAFAIASRFSASDMSSQQEGILIPPQSSGPSLIDQPRSQSQPAPAILPTPVQTLPSQASHLTPTPPKTKISRETWTGGESEKIGRTGQSIVRARALKHAWSESPPRMTSADRID